VLERAFYMATLIAANGKVVTIHYKLELDGGEVVDSSEGNRPFEYLHGASNIVAGLEKGLAGLAAGASFDVRVAPEEGYGTREEGSLQKVPRKSFPKDVRLEVGMQLAAKGDDGRPMPFWVSEITDDTITIDFNHPLAGETLHFTGQVVAVRDATKEELAHGHPHGPHGHDH
jgi:FKBP-type peptidyl-prolyl cis-trans isomerase SlyD